MGEYGAGRVLIKPAVPGTGVLAGGPVRAIMELAGVQNVITKSLGTDNAMNIVKAAAEGLKNMESPVQVAERRGISVAEMFGGKEKLMAETNKTLRLTQVKSAIGRKPNQGQAPCARWAWHGIGSTTEQVDNESVRGMIFKVKHLIERRGNYIDAHSVRHGRCWQAWHHWQAGIPDRRAAPANQ